MNIYVMKLRLTDHDSTSIEFTASTEDEFNRNKSFALFKYSAKNINKKEPLIEFYTSFGAWLPHDIGSSLNVSSMRTDWDKCVHAYKATNSLYRHFSKLNKETE